MSRGQFVMKRALEAGSAVEILASLPDAETKDIPKAAKFGFSKKNGDSGGGEALDSTLEAAPNCLLGLTLVFTGVFVEHERSALETCAKKYGARVTSSISGKTSALVVGSSDVGPSKISKAQGNKTKIINEQGFLELLAQMPAGGGSGSAAERAREKQRQDQVKIEADAKRFKASAASTSASTSAGALKAEPDSDTAAARRETDLWTTKYAPKRMEDICGNPGNVKKLTSWLKNWRHSQKNGFKTGSEGAEFRAAMIHGAPGIGKTTAAHIVADSLGFDIIEYNASDTRSKKLLQEHVSNTLSNTSLAGFMNTKQHSQKPVCIIMDEVDGMSAGDRGGVGAMAQFCRKTNVPLILICNERTSPKMRPFDKICFELPFRRPDAASMRRFLQSVAMAENLELEGPTIDQLVALTRSDIRQTINLLSAYATSRTSMSSDQGVKFAKSWEKESALKPFDIVQRYLSPVTWRDRSIDSKIELYFNDYAFAPLMVQENYLSTTPREGDPLTQALKAAESISDSDLVDKFIHGSEQHWSLMPLHAVLSCVRPSFYINGPTKAMLAFSSWLGNNSKGIKYKRLLAELESHMRLRAWSGTRSIRGEFLVGLVEMLLGPLVKNGTDGIPAAIKAMDEYYINKEDFDVIMELAVGQKTPEQAYKAVPTTVKSAFTRKYNAMDHPLPFMRNVDTKVAAKKEPLPDLDGVVADDMEADPEPEEEATLETEISKDKYIKAKKAKAAPKKAAPKKTAPKKAPAKAKAAPKKAPAKAKS